MSDLVGTHFSLIWEGFEEKDHIPYWLGRLIGTNGVGINPPCACVIKGTDNLCVGYTIKSPYSYEFVDVIDLEEAKQRITDVVKSDLPQTRLRMREMEDKGIWGWKRGF
jgi:hypothetical protein